MATNAPSKLTRLLVLAHHFNALIASDDVRDYAQLATATGLSRARITQIMNLALLAPDIQEIILDLDDAAHPVIFERQLRVLTATPAWKDQRSIWLRLLPPQPPG